jgi:hypothetical protein
MPPEGDAGAAAADAAAGAADWLFKMVPKSVAEPGVRVDGRFDLRCVTGAV